MTNSEAINFLKGYLDEEVYTEKCRNAHKMAIKALEKQENPNSIRINFVGEEEVKEFKEYLKNQQEKCRWNERGMEEWEKLQKKIADYTYMIGLLQDRIEEIEKFDKWILCKLRLPKENGIYIVSYENSVRLLEWFNGKWFFYPSNPAREETGTIIAWQPLPEPFKSHESEGEE